MSNMEIGHEVGEERKRNKKITREKKSIVWKYFHKIDDGRRAQCKYCYQNFSSKCGTTTHLKRHLRSCEKVPRGVIAQPLMIIENNARDSIDQTPRTSGEDGLRTHCLTQEEHQNIHVKNAILMDFPFLPPDVKKAWRSPMGMDVDKEICAYYQREKEKLFSELGNLTSRVCFSIEILEEVGIGSISITAHFINSDFNLVKKLIGFKKLPDFNPDTLFDEAASIIEICISDWKLEDKIFSFTTWTVEDKIWWSDDIDRNDSDLKLSLKEKFKSKMILDFDGMLLSCFKKTVRKWYYDVLRLFCGAEHKKIIKLVEDAWRLYKCKFDEIAFEKRLPPITENWLKGQPLVWYKGGDFWKYCCAAARLFYDALQYKEVFAQCALTNNFTTINLEDINWPYLEEIVGCFYGGVKPTINQLSDFKYPTSNLLFQSTIKMWHALDPHGYDYDYESCPCILYVACVLDPRYKLAFLKYFLQEADWSVWENVINIILEFLEKIFRVYLKEETNQVSPAPLGTMKKNPWAITNGFPLYMKELKTSKILELDQYLSEETVDIGDAQFNVLGWWKANRLRYPVLSRMARDVLAIPACVYSVEENLKLDLAVLRKLKLSPELVEVAICSKDWILSDESEQSPQDVVQKQTDQQQSVLATANDHIHTNSPNYGHKTVNADNGQHDSAVEIPCVTSPSVPGPNKLPEVIISISENNQETPPPQLSPHKQFSHKNLPDEDEDETKAAIHQVSEMIQQKLLYDIKYEGLDLNREETLAIEFVEQIEPTVVIVKMEQDMDNYIRLIGKQMNCLVLPLIKDGEARWLVDEVIDAYINIINHQRDPSHINRSLIVSTLDTLLLRKGLRTMCKTTWKIRELGIKFLNNDLVFFPINIGDVHWIVGALNFTLNEFQILDSKVMTSQITHDRLTYELLSGIQECIQSVLYSNEAMQRKSKQVDVARMNVNIVRTVPQQTDQSSCGLFALRYIQSWDGSTLSSNFSFSQRDMEIFRKKIISELIMSDLNLVKAIPREIRKLLNEVFR